MTTDTLARAVVARRRRALGRGIALAAALFGATACVDEPGRPPTPTGKVDGELTFHNDGVVELDTIVRVQVFSDGGPRSYTLGDVRVLEATGAAEWIIDEIEVDEGGWPVTADGLLDFQTRRVRVKAHTIPEGFVVDPRVEVDVESDGYTLNAALLPTYEQTFEPCEVPAVAPISEALGGALAWSTETLPGIVDAVVDLEVDPLGRTFLATNFLSASFEPGIRVFGAAPGGYTSIAELDGVGAAIAPGNGSGPIIASVGEAPDFTWTETISRRDAELHPVWSHAISNLANGWTPLVATSGGHVLVAARPYEALVIDGVTIPGAGNGFPMLVLFDETTGDYIASRTLPNVVHMVGIGSGAFAIATDQQGGEIPALAVLEPDLSDRWRVLLDGEPRGLAATADGDLWVAHVYEIARHDATGAVVGVVEAPFHESFAPLDDGSVLVGGSDYIARLAIGEPPRFTALPETAADWCRATSSFRVAPGALGPVFAARPSVMTTPGLDGLAIFGGLAL